MTLALLYIFLFLGILIFLFGVFTSKYPKEGHFLKLKGFSIETLTGVAGIRQLLDFIVRDRKGFCNANLQRITSESETNISLKALYLLKIFSLVFLSLLIILVKYTNMDVLKFNIISKSGDSLSFFYQENQDAYTYNYSLYNAVLKRAGEEKLDSLSEAQAKELVRGLMPELIHTTKKEEIDLQTESFIKTHKAVKNIALFDWKVLTAILLSFFMPEGIMLVKKLFLNNMYRKEVIKLENIFELLGSVKGFRTIDILGEMMKSSKVYRKQLEECRDIFKTERELALDTFKASAKSKRLSALADVIRVYACNDKNMALQILERNKNGSDQEILITAEEEMDWVDIIAFASIAPILFELANLLMKPMLDMIFETFKFI